MVLIPEGRFHMGGWVVGGRLSRALGIYLGVRHG
jgi:hypothetical protein